MALSTKSEDTCHQRNITAALHSVLIWAANKRPTLHNCSTQGKSRQITTAYVTLLIWALLFYVSRVAWNIDMLECNVWLHYMASIPGHIIISDEECFYFDPHWHGKKWHLLLPLHASKTWWLSRYYRGDCINDWTLAWLGATCKAAHYPIRRVGIYLCRQHGYWSRSHFCPA